MNTDKLKRLMGEATPGPWELDSFYCISAGLGNGLFYYTINDDGVHAKNPSDPALIVAAVNALPELLAEIADLKQTVIAFAGPEAVRQAAHSGYCEGVLHPHHYDLLERCGARMVDFKRGELPALNQETKP
jgi:hypothetical protein